jgi:alkylation response protein AidB-like acyl-CoA dehydrogenase
MDLRYGERYGSFRDEVREFLRDHWPVRGAEAEFAPEAQEQLFRERALARGYVYRHFPRVYGGSEQPPDALEDSILDQEFAAAGAPRDIRGIGPAMLAPTLLDCGSEAQRLRFIPPTLRGDMRWCQGYSEPGAGSDLSSLSSRAVLDGDSWVIDGHKIWTSDAQNADYMFGLFRTEPDAPKHAGISYLLIDMRTPGLLVRPLRQMTGGAEFNEVFFTAVRIPADSIVGKRGEGWKVSRSTLKHERNLIGDPRFLRNAFDALVELARRSSRNGRPAIEDTHVRQRLAEIEGYVSSQEYSGLRQLSAALRGEEAKALLPILMNKLYSTDTTQRITRLAFDLLGADGLVAPGPAEYEMSSQLRTPGGWVAQYMFAIANSIAGGASNIQRNIIGERGLGLPRDPRPG